MINAVTLGIPDAPLYYMMAAEHVDDPSIWEDCVQEAAIHVWRLQQRGLNQSHGYYMQAARRRIKEVSKRGTFLGYTSQRGRPVDPLRKGCLSLDAMLETTSNQEADE